MLTLLIALSVVVAMLVFAARSARRNAPVLVRWRPCGKEVTRSIVTRIRNGDLNAGQLYTQARIFEDLGNYPAARHMRDLVAVAQIRDRIAREEREQAAARRAQAHAQAVTL